MKDSFSYIFKTKFGILFTAAVAAVVMVLVSVVFSFGLTRQYKYITSDPSFTEEYPDQAQQEQFIEDVLGENFRRSSVGNAEVVSLIAVVICFALMLENAFGTLTQNGMSRKTSAKAMLAAVPVTALLLTLEDMILRCVARSTIFINSRSLYHIAFRQSKQWSGSYSIMADKPAFSAEAEYIIFYFAAALMLLSAVVCIYGLFRRHGVTGAVCTLVGSIAVYFALTLQPIPMLFIAAAPIFCAAAFALSYKSLTQTSAAATIQGTEKA